MDEHSLWTHYVTFTTQYNTLKADNFANHVENEGLHEQYTWQLWLRDAWKARQNSPMAVILNELPWWGLILLPTKLHVMYIDAMQMIDLYLWLTPNHDSCRAYQFTNIIWRDDQGTEVKPTLRVDYVIIHKVRQVEVQDHTRYMVKNT